MMNIRDFMDIIDAMHAEKMAELNAISFAPRRKKPPLDLDEPLDENANAVASAKIALARADLQDERERYGEQSQKVNNFGGDQVKKSDQRAKLSLRLQKKEASTAEKVARANEQRRKNS